MWPWLINLRPLKTKRASHNRGHQWLRELKNNELIKVYTHTAHIVSRIQCDDGATKSLAVLINQWLSSSEHLFSVNSWHTLIARSVRSVKTLLVNDASLLHSAGIRSIIISLSGRRHRRTASASNLRRIRSRPRRKVFANRFSPPPHHLPRTRADLCGLVLLRGKS